MEDKIVLLMATIPEREKFLSRIIDTLYNQVDEMRIVFNNYPKIPDWIKEKSKIIPLLNTPDKYTSNAVWLMMNGINGYVFTADDDIIYPSNYVSVMLSRLKEKLNSVVVSMYGELIHWPIINYKSGRRGLGFARECTEDILVDIAGVGCSAFHTNILRPKISDFPDIYSRDLWFAILAAKNKIPIIRIKSGGKWLHKIETGGPEIRRIWRNSRELTKRRQEVFVNILVPLLENNRK